MFAYFVFSIKIYFPLSSRLPHSSPLRYLHLFVFCIIIYFLCFTRIFTNANKYRTQEVAGSSLLHTLPANGNRPSRSPVRLCIEESVCALPSSQSPVPYPLSAPLTGGQLIALRGTLRPLVVALPDASLRAE